MQRSSGNALDQLFIDEMTDLRHSITRLSAVIEGMDGGLHAHVPNASRGVATAFPIGYLPSSFRFPIGLTPEDCWHRWHAKERPLRAITIKMLPDTVTLAERARQSNLRRKMKGVMEILAGTTPNKTIDLDVDFVWKACWSRCVALFGIREPCSLVVTTLYDWLVKQQDKVKQAREAPPIALHEAATAAAEAATATASAAAGLAAAVAANPPVRSVSAALGSESVAVIPLVRSVRAAAVDAAPLPATLAAAVAANPPEPSERAVQSLHEAVLSGPPLTLSAHSAVVTVQLQQLLDVHICHEQVPDDLPDSGVRCKHCRGTYKTLKCARKHHGICRFVKRSRPPAPCASLIGCQLDDTCFDISLALRLGAAHHLNFDHVAAQSAARRFIEAEQFIAANQAAASAAAADALLLP